MELRYGVSTVPRATANGNTVIPLSGYCQEAFPMADWVVASDIAARIADLRTVLGVSQTVLGKRFGKGWKQAGAWERGEQRPHKTTLQHAEDINGWPVAIFAEGGPMPSQVVKRRQITEVDDAEGDAPEGPGWLWEDPREAEDAFRSYVRNVERSVRGMVGDPDQVKLKELRLVVIDMARSGARAAGRPVPPFVQVVENEIIAGTFR
jgi:transcriptional regulator with XRE-family HTH domain